MKVVFALALLFLLKPASSVANPVTDSVIIDNFVFDSSGSPWLDEWMLAPDWRSDTNWKTDTALLFFRDSPPGSSAKWSISLVPGPSVSRSLTNLSSGIYQLSCWAKSLQNGGGLASITQGGNEKIIGLATFADSAHRDFDTNWIQYFLTDTLTLTSSDTIQITLSGEMGQILLPPIRDLINNITFVKLLPTGGVNASVTSVAFQLGQNYPNPFPGQTTIPFTLDKPSVVMLKVLNMLGITVCNVFSGPLDVGAQHLSFDRSKLPNGDYIYELTVQNDTGFHRQCKIMSVE